MHEYYLSGTDTTEEGDVKMKGAYWDSVLSKQLGTGVIRRSWSRHQMETFSVLLALCAVTSEFPSQRPVTQSFDGFFILCLE